MPSCGTGLHTITFRYLQSTGNNKHMLLGGDGGDAPVHFSEPDSFASADTFTWVHTDPVVVDMAGGFPALFLSSMSTADLELLSPAPPGPLQERRPTGVTDELDEEEELTAEDEDQSALGQKSKQPGPPSPPPYPNQFSKTAFSLRAGYPGPVIDSMSITPGASYLRQEEMNSGWREAHENVIKRAGGSDPLVQKFCYFDYLDSENMTQAGAYTRSLLGSR